MFKGKIPRSYPSFLIAFIFLINSFACPYAEAEGLALPAPGTMVRLSQPFDLPMLKGIRIYPDNPLRFDFILDKGNGRSDQERLTEESTKLIKYFLASLTIPENDLWVNLSPYEKDRIIPQNFGLTEMGGDLLAEDYMLKQITASLIYPEDQLGKRFWKRIYEVAQKKFGTTNIPVNTFNKVWIIPEKALVYENAKAGTAYVVGSRLKVMLEEDYLSMKKHALKKETNALGNQIVREIVLPELEKEVNEGRNFAQLRQVYNSLILATWYKKKIKDSLLTRVYADKNKVAGVNIQDPLEKEKIYQQYLMAFKKGVYNYIREEIDPSTQETVPKKYFSGGASFYLVDGVLRETENSAMITPDMGLKGHDTIVKVRLDRAMNTAVPDHQELVDHIALIPQANDTRVVLVIPGKLLVDPAISKLIEKIRAEAQDFAMAVENNGHARLTFRIKERVANVKASMNFIPWERHASRVLLAGTVLLTPIALFASVPERIVSTVDTVLLAVILVLELVDRQAKRFRSDHEYYLKVLKNFYENGAFTNGHTSREVMKFYMNYYKDFVDDLDDDQEVRTLKLLAGTLTREEVEVLRKKKKKVKFEQRLEWALDEHTIDLEQQRTRKEEFIRVHETYLNAFRDANKEQRKLQPKFIADAQKFYNQNDSNFKGFLAKQQQDEMAQHLATQLSEAAKKRIVALGQKQPTAIQELMYWDLEYKMAEEGERAPVRAQPELLQQRSNEAMISQEPQSFDADQAKEYFARQIDQPDRANKDFPGVVRMNTKTGKLLMSISSDPYGNGSDHNALLRGTFFRQNTISGKSEWILMKWEYGADGKLKHLSLVPPSIPKNNYSLMMKFFLGLTTDHSSDEEYERRIHDEIIIIAGLIRDGTTDPENVEVATSLSTMHELADLNQNLRVLAELPTYNDQPDELDDLDALLTYLRNKEDFSRGTFVETGDMPVRVKDGIHARVSAPLVKIANHYRAHNVQIELVQKGPGAKERVYNMNSILEISLAGIKAGDVRLRVFGAGEQTVKEIEGKVRSVLDPAMDAVKPGGIDLNSNKIILQIHNDGQEVKFLLDPAMFAQLKNAPGFYPQVLSLEPLIDLQQFLGIV
jgi:phosphotransferase system HPr-like phosphotransfer protein